MGNVFNWKKWSLCLSAVLILGCSTLRGTVTPLEDGQYKSFASSNTKKGALKMAGHDAQLTCKEAGKGGYVVVSQDDNRVGLGELDTGNAVFDRVMNMSEVGEFARKNTSYEVTTIFKCQ